MKTDDYEICWVSTPQCSKCVPKAGFSRRRGCMGCDRLKKSVPKPQCKLRLRRAILSDKRTRRDVQIVKLRGQGLSYSKIAMQLGLPRSTVQSAAKRAGTQ